MPLFLSYCLSVKQIEQLRYKAQGAGDIWLKQIKTTFIDPRMPSWISAQDVSTYHLLLTLWLSLHHLQLCFLWIAAQLGEAESAISPPDHPHPVPTQVAPQEISPSQSPIHRAAAPVPVWVIIGLPACLGAHDRRPGVAKMGKGSLLTKKTMITSVSRTQPDKTVPMGPGYLPSREKGNTGLGLFEFSREEVLTVSPSVATNAWR